LRFKALRRSKQPLGLLMMCSGRTSPRSGPWLPRLWR